MRLADCRFCSAYLDLEEGIKFSTTIVGVGGCLTFIASLAVLGVKLWDRDFMQEFGGKFGAYVWVTHSIVGRVPDAASMFESMGSLRSGPDGLAPWMMPPGWA